MRKGQSGWVIGGLLALALLIIILVILIKGKAVTGGPLDAIRSWLP